MTIRIEPLSPEEFAPYGDVLDASGDPDALINQGLCGRYHDRARMDFGPRGRAGISIFRAELRSLPYRLDMVERHPDGSQAFLPMDSGVFLVVVALDRDGKPDGLRAFRAFPGQGVNYLRNVWPGVLAPLNGSGIYAVVDRIGDTRNLEEHWFAAPFTIED